MKEIVFTTPMVCAITDGRKTQTRRLVKPQPYCIAHPQPIGEKWYVDYSSEAWGIYDTYAEMVEEYRRLIRCPYGKVGDRLSVRKSCLLLEIVAVHIERLQDISFDDIDAEGALRVDCIYTDQCAKDYFAKLWDSINGKKEGAEWESNPFVWVIEFKRLETAAND